MNRVVAFAYGTVAYVIFFATFCYMIGFVGDLAVPKSIDSGLEGSPGAAYLINIALLGLSAGVARPVDGPEPYRTARVDLLADRFDGDAGFEEKLRRAFAEAVPGGGDVEGLREQLLEFLAAEDVPAALLNTCALTAPLEAAEKLELLETRSVSERLDRLLELLARPWRWN